MLPATSVASDLRAGGRRRRGPPRQGHPGPTRRVWAAASPPRVSYTGGRGWKEKGEGGNNKVNVKKLQFFRLVLVVNGNGGISSFEVP